MPVPLLDLKIQYQALKPEIDAALIRVAESQISILGPEVDALERELEAYLGVKHAIGVSSGTDALLMAMMAYDIGPGDEVIMPTFSFFATAGCVSRVGATPVFVDVDNVTFNIDVEQVRKAITPRTKAIIPVHLFGQAADIDALVAIGREHNIPIIEDAAQAIGTQTADGRRLGGIGEIGCFSFYPTKNLGALGDAGLVTTNDDALNIKLRQIRNHGMEPRYYHKIMGGNFRLDAMQGAALRVKLPHLPSWHAGRRRNAALYTKLFIESGVSSGVGHTKFDENNLILLPASVHEGASPDVHIFNQFTIRSAHRDALRAHLQSKGIGAEIYYPVPFHRQECFASLNLSDAAFPISNCLAATVLAVPIYPELTEDQIREVVATIVEFERTMSSTPAECADCAECGTHT
ncbi:MAG: DegT/DnrJ/EryC1/StrS family aminotransferase [Ignavibacteria bacterium]|nr:DegT/DnrJ/EryC1/StrS family aminotransferase [Ignavibacteria bacterium]MBK7033664.1 DegT/DnrJ/EryC1/StrS family aminotransferase [Ignavibacteria bacterium]MBL0323027.1 DegT/DnrJ/EryC1/StrS family aminotransferase [Ignavibacteria bacterium]MBP7093910.1 DegT/DnrJ/EryC1/StrS family aminotransferase [Candidatus Kapabacteria bacterium]